MFIVSDTIHINAPIDRCFLLSTHVGLASRTLEMRPVAGKTQGLAGHGDKVKWAGWRFGLYHVHETQITHYERPAFFQDTMRRGRFRKYQHDHQFMEIDGHTLLIDRLRFSIPFGWAGKKIGKKLLVPAIAARLRRRLELLKTVAESNEWRRYLAEGSVERPCEADEPQSGLSRVWL